MIRVWTAALAATVALAACGGGEEPAASIDGPARLVPAQGTVAYAEVVVRPDDDRARDIEAALFKISGRRDLLDRLVAEIDGELADEAGLSYERDIDPWLGERAGIFFLDFDDEPDGAVVLEVTDEAKARAALDEARPEFEDGTVGDLVDGHVVFGTQAGLDAARNAAAGRSLGESDTYREALEPLDDERLGNGWIDLRSLLEGFAGLPGVESYRDALRDTENATAAVGFDVDDERIAIEATAEREVAERLGGGGSAATELLADLPGDAWLAFGLGGVGRLLGEGFTEGLRESGQPGLDILGEIERQTGVDLRADVFDRIEDVALYASGTGLTSLGAGAIVSSTDAGALVDALERLVTTIGEDSVTVEPDGPGFLVRLGGAPITIQVGHDGDRVAAGLGSDAGERLLEPRDRLEDADAYDAAVDDLADGASLTGFVDVAPMVELISSLAGDEPGWAQARRYVEAFERLSIGEREDGDVIVSEIVARLR